MIILGKIINLNLFNKKNYKKLQITIFLEKFTLNIKLHFFL